MSKLGIEKNDYYHFSVVDHAVFASMLLLSACTGLYYGCRSKYCDKAQNLSEYLTGSRNLRPFPVAMSLVASYVSGVTILGTPAEIYNFGSQYWLIALSIWLSGTVITFVYLPVFCKLQVNSSYEYLELRFNRVVRTMASVFFVMDEMMFLPIIIYVPSLAFNQVTGININLIGTIVAAVCIFYTLLGGLKAVVWTDTWQIIVMFISTVVVVILGTIAADGLKAVFHRYTEGDRLIFFDTNPSMYQTYTVFSVIFGGFTYWTAFNSVNQTMVQRYMSLPSLKQAKLALFLFTIGVSVFVSMCCYSGVLVYATYQGCDPLDAGRIKANDQLLPLFVMETVGHLRGVPGLFIAGVFGAALSSLSVVLNSTSQVFLEDFLKGCMRMHLTEARATLIVKGVVLVLGFVAVGLLFIVEHMGGILQMATSFTSIAAGTSFGVFSLGMLCPWANSYGAIAGSIAGFILSTIITYGGQYVSAVKMVVPHRFPVRVDQCFEKYGINVTSVEPSYPDESDVFPLFRLSYLWITPIGAGTVILVGIIVSLFTGKRDISRIDPDLISPAMQWVLPGEAQRHAGSSVRKLRNREIVESENMIEISTVDLKDYEIGKYGKLEQL